MVVSNIQCWDIHNFLHHNTIGWVRNEPRQTLGLVVNQFKSNQFSPKKFPPFGQKRLKTICIIQLPI